MGGAGCAGLCSLFRWEDESVIKGTSSPEPCVWPLGEPQVSVDIWPSGTSELAGTSVMIKSGL